MKAFAFILFMPSTPAFICFHRALPITKTNRELRSGRVVIIFISQNPFKGTSKNWFPNENLLFLRSRRQNLKRNAGVAATTMRMIFKF